MNKADKAKALAHELSKAEPGLVTAFFAVGAVIVFNSIVFLTVFGLMFAIRV